MGTGCCNNICQRYKALKPSIGGRYTSGQKRCQVCCIYIIWEGLWCPCCGYRLRLKPRQTIRKEIYNTIKNVGKRIE